MTEPPSVFPMVVLETERLIMRAFTDADIEDVYLAVSHPSTQVWLPLPAPGQPYTLADAAEWCRVRAPEARASGDGQQWAVLERGTGGFVGACGLLRTLWRAQVTEVGYWLAPWQRGKGYATEAVAAVARWALRDLGFERLELKAAVGNTASRRVAEKAGFVYEGVERNAMPLHEGRTDLAVYSLIPGDVRW
ncbi:GNAT family N-acetyltransferase [Marinitenerispora sediminis]|uniref:N-acetyltransferase n=1 Tax=Marinitenerispora sediminis TaxID=1931232 RepID=A0A368T4X1_9ACTN|nr:GNAT family N-acetyltransferase [Marinitenerispora sediminis]RCV54289.1 N-acetyltransferase [Marinitenerispora sediminis]RCV56423.1 N-acetyltransferase [Marinitenerispora sediminis]RCV58625.1 N-acetyltransferase [Marinitenerispora sediminis]